MPDLARLARAAVARTVAGRLRGGGARQLRPGHVAGIRGIVFQSDARSLVAGLVIRPFELLDRCVAGVRRTARFEALANHVGVHVVMADGREVVAEQLVGTAYEDFDDGLNWTPVARFRARERGGWDVTVPATSFRGVDARVVSETVERLNATEGHPFLGEDCTQFVERAFGGRRLFADSPLLQRLGVGARVGDPALPLLRPDARLDHRAEVLLRAEAARALPDPMASHDAPNVRHRLRRVIALLAVAGVAAVVVVRARRAD